MTPRNLTKTEQEKLRIKGEQVRREMGFWLPKRKLFPEEVSLKDYQPKSILKVSEHVPKRAKFPVIDAHTHVFHPSIIGLDQTVEGLPHFLHKPDDILRAMDEVGLEKIVNLGCGTGETLDNFLNTYVHPHPDRFIVFASFNWNKLLRHKDFGKLAANELEKAINKGADGLKLWKNLGLTLRDASGKLLCLNDTRLFPIYEKAKELDIPIAIHCADPPSFFQPVDRTNESYLTLIRKPEWSFYGNEFPMREEVLQQRNNIIEVFPDVIFIGVHFGCFQASDLISLGELLDKYPNYYIDTAAQVNTLGLQPYSARRFFLEYQDRILFGTDFPPSVAANRQIFRFFETDDEYFNFQVGRGALYGIHLPDDVLKKIYYENAKRVLKI